MFVAQAHSFASQARLAITLSWVAGYTNILCLLVVAHPTSHISGTASLLGQSLVEPSKYAGAIWPLIFILAAFLFGAGVSGLLTETGRRRGWDSIYVLPIAVEALLLVAVALSIELTSRVPLDSGPALWTIIGCSACAMGLQNATITRISAGVVRTTHVTGVATDLGMETAQLLINLWDHRRRGAPHPHHHHRKHENPLSAKRLALLLSIFGSFIFGAALAALLYDHDLTRPFAVYPPVLFLLWIIYIDSTRPIAEIEAVGSQHALPGELAIFHVRRDARRKGKTHRLPNLLAWVDRLPDNVRVVVLDLDQIAVLDDNAAMELRAAIGHLTQAHRKLVIAGITVEQYAQLDLLGVVTQLAPLSIHADLDLAIARGLSLL